MAVVAGVCPNRGHHVPHCPVGVPPAVHPDANVRAFLRRVESVDLTPWYHTITGPGTVVIHQQRETYDCREEHPGLPVAPAAFRMPIIALMTAGLPALTPAQRAEWKLPDPAVFTPTDQLYMVVDPTHRPPLTVVLTGRRNGQLFQNRATR